MATDGMSYEETGELRTTRKAARQTIFKDLSTSDIIMGGVRELYRRYDTEIWQALSVILIIVLIIQVVT